MNAAADNYRSSYRSEAFAEDVEDLVEPAPKAVPQRSRGASMLWLLGLLPLAALAVGVSWVV